MSSNQVATQYIYQNGYTKAHTAMVEAAEREAATIGSGNSRADAMDVDKEGDVVASGKSNKQPGATASTPPFVERGLKETDFNKRNLPVAQAASASTRAPIIDEHFMAQAKDIVARHKKENMVGDGMLDPSDRVRGYKRLRRWVETGLDGWKPELRELLFPVFVHTFLDLIDADLGRAASEFFADHLRDHMALHSHDISTLSAVSLSSHILTNPLVKLFRTEKYVVNMSSASYGLFMGWLSDVGLEALWDTGREIGPGRQKEAVRNIVVQRLDLRVTDSARPLTIKEMTHDAGFTSTRLTTDGYNAVRPLRLGPAALSGRLQQVVRSEIAEDDQQAASRGEEVPKSDATAAKAQPTVETKYLVPPIEANAVPTAMDVERELQAIRDQRKRIRLGTDPKTEPRLKTGLPSICTFTLFDQGEGTTSTAISQDSTLLAAGSAESCVRVWSLKGELLKSRSLDADGEVDSKGTVVRKLIGHSGPVYSLSFDPMAGPASQPNHLLSSSQDGSVRLWSLETWQNLVLYKGHVDPVWDVQWAPMGVHFATGSRDRTARLWMTERIAPVRMYAGHLSDVECVRFHPNSLYLATGSADRSCRLWDVHRGDCVRVFLEHEDAVNCIAMSPDGRYLASASEDRRIILWDIGSGRLVKEMTGHTSTISSLTFSADSAILTSGGLDCTVRCWDVKGSAERSNMAVIGGVLGDGLVDPFVAEHGAVCPDLLATYRTKRTPITTTQYTPRNLCLAVGTYIPEERSHHA